VLRIRDVGAIRSDGLAEVRANGAVFGRLGLHAPRTIAANSKAAIRNAIRMGVPPARLELLPNVVDCDHFRPAARREDGPVRLLAVGRLAGMKRLDLLLAVVADLRRRSARELRLTLVGDGPCRPQLERQAADLGLLPHMVRFAGPVEDVAPHYREADVLVLTSDWEGTPNVVLEAMASGLPVVATSVGGVPDVVSDRQTGYLVPQGDVNAIASALLPLVHDAELREDLGRRARQFIIANHSRQRMPAILQTLYGSVFS
jgi:glycosyltransferase involved in cell wall biosynthesis